MPTVYIVSGPPRSGTSLVAGILHKLGVSMGSRFPSANDNNPTGFWVDLELEGLAWDIQLNRDKDALDKLVAAIAARDATGQDWGVKTQFGDFMAKTIRKHSANAVKVITTMRDAAKSKESMRLMSNTKASLRDEQYQFLTSKIPATVDLAIDFESLIENADAEVDRLATFVSKTNATKRAESKALIDPQYWRVR